MNKITNGELRRLIKQTAESHNGWVMREARTLAARLERHPKSEILFETGYGPSGLPHIGTFGEVFRTTMVRYGFSLISDVPTRLICFSDDMDGLRKIPDNVPNHAMLVEHLHKPLTEVPDPFGTSASFGAHNNSLLQEFLDRFGFDYEFISSSAMYRAGSFDSMLLRALEKYDDILAIMLPSLREERRATYSPFLPICTDTGRVLQAVVLDRDVKRGTILYCREDGKEVETLVTGGRCKLQWKPDWGMRWAGLGVDYEMSGKDLSESVTLSARIAKVLGGIPPEGFSYELFLDENGQKISKSKGNGLTIDEWLHYAPRESLSYFMFQRPRTAKRLYFDVIPKNVDSYLSDLGLLQQASEAGDVKDVVKGYFNSAAWFIHQGQPVQASPPPVSFSLLLNLVGAGKVDTAETLIGFIRRYAPQTDIDNPLLQELVQYALRYYDTFVAPTRRFILLTKPHREAVQKLYDSLREADDSTMGDSEALQTLIFNTGKEFGYEPLRRWFEVLYTSLLGQDQGPRLGTLFAILGRDGSLALIDNALNPPRSESADEIREVSL